MSVRTGGFRLGSVHLVSAILCISFVGIRLLKGGLLWWFQVGWRAGQGD